MLSGFTCSARETAEAVGARSGGVNTWLKQGVNARIQSTLNRYHAFSMSRFGHFIDGQDAHLPGRQGACLPFMSPRRSKTRRSILVAHRCSHLRELQRLEF